MLASRVPITEAPWPRPRPFGGWPDPAGLAGCAAAGLWVAFCVRWFDAAAPWRPAALAAVSALPILVACLLAASAWLRGRWRTLAAPPLGAAAPALLLALALAFFFRLPVVVGGAGAAVTPDGALSGIVALHAANGTERLVFVPQVPYSGSLKSHLTAPLALVMDPARAFALVSVAFYLAYVAGLFRLALLVAGPRAAFLAGLYAAFSPAFVTRYSLSNDGNYVEVLALGTWALWLAARWAQEPGPRPQLALAAGLLLGLGFWCHILAIIHLAAIAAVLALVAATEGAVLAGARSLLALVAGWAIGYGPGWLWNAANDWESFHYLVPGAARTDEAGASGLAAAASGLGERLRLMVVRPLAGADGVRHRLRTGGGRGARARSPGWASRPRSSRRATPPCARGASGRGRSPPSCSSRSRTSRSPSSPCRTCPATPATSCSSCRSCRSSSRTRSAGAPGGGGSSSVCSSRPAPSRPSPRCRTPCGRTRGGGSSWPTWSARACASATRTSSWPRGSTSSRPRGSSAPRSSGPITTEYFFEYRERVERAPEAAIVAVNATSAGRLEEKLAGLGVRYERLDLMKPVLLRFSRKVDPQDLFPGRAFPMR